LRDRDEPDTNDGESSRALAGVSNSVALEHSTSDAVMTPAVVAVWQAGLEFSLHEYDPAASSPEPAAALGIDRAGMFKTLIAGLDGKRFVVAVVPVPATLDLKALAAVAKGKTARMADPRAAARATGYSPGAISPVGQRVRRSTVIDESALLREWIYVSAGKRGWELRLRPRDLVRLCQATVARITAPAPRALSEGAVLDS
jgi:Cys-tRNA(Pro)/Cys-tRNA(Cys) deacylase